ncbi:hypothetical protein [Haladaptatus sp. DYF46]|uniref:hypothetical protein n=1 Tax=Haladaptatus sp. DYF46 TaxID=2886041 RepID=UPI001E54C474|nr:hypothetical protein [Haladaptatus sp. DYF46]
MIFNGRVGNRMREAIFGAILPILSKAFSTVLETTSETVNQNSGSSQLSTDLIIFSFHSFPDWVTLAGLVITLTISGPFALIGFPLELGGANLLVSGGKNGFYLLLFGAILNVLGAVIGGWKPFLRLLD